MSGGEAQARTDSVAPASTWAANLLAPIRTLRIAYAPVLGVYATSGALGLIAVADSFWVKGRLALSPTDLAAIAVWLQLPWVAKMAIAELVDALPWLQSRRRLTIVFGAGLTATGLLMLVAAARGWLAAPERVYVAAQLLIVIGGVIQEVVADAIVPSLVPRMRSDGMPRPQREIADELAMVEVVARIVYTLAALIAGGLSGLLAARFDAGTVFLVALIVPMISIAGAFATRIAPGPGRAFDPLMLGGGCALALLAVVIGLADFAMGQETLLVAALVILAWLLRHLSRVLPPDIARGIAWLAVLAFAFRATPSIGDGYRWYAIDRLGFDEAFFGVLQVTGSAIGLTLMWFLAGWATRASPVRVVLVLTGTAAALLVPMWINAQGIAVPGIGPRGLALVDEAAQSPLALLVTVPLLARVAIHAPAERRAAWFAVVASLMSLAIVAGQLVTKHLTIWLPIARADYTNVPAMATAVLVLNVTIPLAAILVCRRGSRA